jgi:hypothetical protein
MWLSDSSTAVGPCREVLAHAAQAQAAAGHAASHLQRDQAIDQPVRLQRLRERLRGMLRDARQPLGGLAQLFGPFGILGPRSQAQRLLPVAPGIGGDVVARQQRRLLPLRPRIGMRTLSIPRIGKGQVVELFSHATA